MKIIGLTIPTVGNKNWNQRYGLVSELLKRTDTRTHVRAKFLESAQNFNFWTRNSNFFHIFGTIWQSFSNLVCFYSNFSAQICAKFYQVKFWPRKKITFRRSAHYIEQVQCTHYTEQINSICCMYRTITKYTIYRISKQYMLYRTITQYTLDRTNTQYMLHVENNYKVHKYRISTKYMLYKTITKY